MMCTCMCMWQYRSGSGSGWLRLSVMLAVYRAGGGFAIATRVVAGGGFCQSVLEAVKPTTGRNITQNRSTSPPTTTTSTQ